MIARPISHEARLPLLTHVGELRMRLIACVAALTVAFGFAFWQNHAILNVLNRPLAKASAGALQHSRGPLAQTARTQQALRVALNREHVAFALLAQTSTGRSAVEPGPPPAPPKADADAVAVPPREARGRQPVTLGIGEP